MHNFSDKPQCQYVKKFRASVSLNGRFVDILDIQDNVKACFSIVVKFGKAILEEQINHTTIIIPTSHDVEKVSPFSYNLEDNIISATIFLTNGLKQDFVTSVDDLMNMNYTVFHPTHSCPPLEPPKPETDCECACKPEHDYFDKPFHPGYGDYHHGFEHNKPCDRKPMCGPYATQSELRAESKHRQCSDKSIYNHLDILTNNLKKEENRSIHTDKVQDEKIYKLENDLKDIKHKNNFQHIEVHQAIKNESDERQNTYNELYKITQNIQNDGIGILNELEKTNKRIHHEIDRARNEERIIRDILKREEEERSNHDRDITNAIRIEEQNRKNEDRELSSKIKNEEQRAKNIEEEIRHDLIHNFKNLEQKYENLDKKIMKLHHYVDNNCQPKGDYVEYTTQLDGIKNITLPNKSNLIGKTSNDNNYPMIGVSENNIVEVGTKIGDLHLSGNSPRLQYNNTTLVNTDDITKFVPYSVYSKLDEKVSLLREELELAKINLRTLNETVAGILSKI